YLLWGMKPFGYHLTNLLLHGTNAALFYLVARRVLARAAPSFGASTLTASATAAALFFALHPLRAESRAWVTERRDLLSGFFCLLALLTYLAAREAGANARRWEALSIAAYTLACLSKSIVVTLPVILLLLDVYPLGRLGLRPWRTPAARALVTEKAPYFGLAALTAAMAVWAQHANHYLTSLEQLSVLQRGPLALYGLAFYAGKTVLPIGLSPLYEMPRHVNVLEPRFALSALAALVATVVF